MRHFLGLSLLFASLATGAIAQTQSPNTSPAVNAAAVANIKPGDYSGRLSDAKGRSADVKIALKHITADGRVSARVTSSDVQKSCAKPLPLNGLVLPDGTMRLDVDDGAPTGCQRIYNVRLEPGGKASGTFIDAPEKRASKSAPK